jgi:polar amino acid transport system substrate-binding protein
MKPEVSLFARFRTIVRYAPLCCLMAGTGVSMALPAAHADALETIESKKVIRWCADPSGGAPFVYYDPKDTAKVIGFEMEIAEAIGKAWGMRTELVPAEWSALIDEMRAKRCDFVMNGIEVTPEREKRVLFSTPYYRYQQQLTVRATDKDRYHNLTDLKGHTIGTLNSAAANSVLRAAGFGDTEILEHADSLTPYTNLGLKRVDAVLQESIIASYYAGKNAALYNVPETFSPGVYSVAFRSADTTLRDRVNQTLEQLKRDGTLAKIYTTWGIMSADQTSIGIVDATTAAPVPTTTEATPK